jgi:hypothetical protein
VADEHCSWSLGHGLAHDLFGRERPVLLDGTLLELGVEETGVMAGIDQRPADREQAERRKVIVRDAAPDRGVRRVDEEDAHRVSTNEKAQRRGRYSKNRRDHSRA